MHAFFTPGGVAATFDGMRTKCVSFAVLATGAVLLSVAAPGCRQQDIRTVTVQVPAMKNEACAERVSEAVASELVSGAGEHANRQIVRSLVLSGAIVPDLANRTVIVRYDSLRLSLKNVEFAIADAGFEANNTPASAQAAAQLPPECR